MEQLVPDQFWIEAECKYDIASMYGISHWWFQRQRFYIDRFSSEGDRRAVRTHMRILSVVRIEVFSMYGYNYMKKIVLRRADLKEYVTAERDFKYMYPSDFEDLYLLNLQGHLNHLSPEDKKILTNAVNLWTKNLVIRQHSPRAVTFRDKYGVQMIIRFNEIPKFSDGTLQQIDEALDYRVKEFQIIKSNPGMKHQIFGKVHVPMIPPEPEGLYPGAITSLVVDVLVIADIEDIVSWDPVDSCTTLSLAIKIPQRILVSFLTEIQSHFYVHSLRVSQY
ncbi:hypothetical protein Tco_0320657 [Tanacetum coccineum]